jgi:hypothetical protein
MDDELEVFAQGILKFDTLEVTEICGASRMPDGVVIDVGASNRWCSIEVTRRGILYYKQFGEADTAQPDFDAQAWADRAEEIIDGSTARALMLLFYCTAAVSSLSSQVYRIVYETIDWYEAKYGAPPVADPHDKSLVSLFDTTNEAYLLLQFREPKYAYTFNMTVQRAVGRGHDINDVIQDLILCLDMLDQYDLN